MVQGRRGRDASGRSRRAAGILGQCEHEFVTGLATNQLLLAHVEPEHLDPDESIVDATSLFWPRGEVRVQTLVMAGNEPDESFIRSAASAALARERSEIVETSAFEEHGEWTVWLTLRVPMRGQTVGDAVRRADSVRAVVQAALDGGVDLSTARDLVRAGHARALIGTYESVWLEAKAAPYRLAREADSYELAKDVAALANAAGGIIVIGAKTKSRPDGDEISQINECRLSDVSPRAYKALIRRRVFPKIEGFDVDLIEGAISGSGIALLAVPEQSQADKPFLVHGMVEGKRTTGRGLTWPTREGAETLTPSIETIHALLRAGEQVLRGGTAEELAHMRADLQRLEDQALEDWLRDIAPAARLDGFNVAPGPGNVTFTKPGHEPVVVQRSTPGPPADLLQRQQLLERLQQQGLRVATTPRGFLIPARGFAE